MKKLGRIIRTILLVLILIAAVLFIVAEAYPMVHDRVRTGALKTDGAASWMAGIDDEKLLSDISIPGAHDAATNESHLRLMTKCQDRTISEILSDGFRYLDIRLGIEKINGEDNLTFYHGFLSCLTDVYPWSRHLTFEDAAKACGDFLKANPSETILFVVKKETEAGSDEAFQHLLQTLIGKSETKDLWLLTDTIPTLKEARGKIVLFRRYADTAGYQKQAGIYLNWENQSNKSSEGENPGAGTTETETFTLRVQDRYKYDVDAKWKVFTATAEEGLTKKPGDVLINFLSSNGTQTYGHPYALAAPLNQRLSESTGKLPGWTIIDFCDADLAKRIYSSNP